MRFLFAIGVVLVGCGHAPPQPGGSGSGTSAPPASCAVLAPAACAANKACGVIHGSPIDPARNCFGAEEALGCHDANTACGDAITIGRDAQGRRFWFGDTCLPAGFTPEVQTETTVLPHRC